MTNNSVPLPGWLSAHTLQSPSACGLYPQSFSVTAVTNYHKLHHLKQHDLPPYSSGGQKSKKVLTGLKSKVSAGLQSFLEALGESLFSRFFCFLGATGNPRLWPPSISKVNNSWWSLSHKHHGDASLFLL